MYEYNIHIIPYTNEIYRGHPDTRTPFAERTELVCASKWTHSTQSDEFWTSHAEQLCSLGKRSTYSFLKYLTRPHGVLLCHGNKNNALLLNYITMYLLCARNPQTMVITYNIRTTYLLYLIHSVQRTIRVIQKNKWNKILTYYSMMIVSFYLEYE